jgi:hypothetical protein
MRGSLADSASDVYGIRAPYDRWSHSLQVMELPGVAEARRQVTEHVTDVLGLLSWRRFPVITARFVRELEARVKAESTLSRAELVALCQALHRLHIGLSGQVQAPLSLSLSPAKRPTSNVVLTRAHKNTRRTSWARPRCFSRA